MSKFKVGDKVTVTNHRGNMSKLMHGSDSVGKSGEVNKYTEDNFVGLLLDGESDDSWLWIHVNDIKLMEKTMDNLEVDDVLVKDGFSYDLIVQGFMGDIIFTLDTDGDVDTTTVKRLRRDDWKLKNTSEPKELTVAEISDALGFEVKVVK